MSCNFTRRSTIGFCIYMESTLISWKTKKQSDVSRSSSEVEYRPLASAACELQWIMILLQELQINTSDSANLFYNNRAARHITQNPVFHKHNIHIEIKCHVVRQRLQNRLFHLVPIKGFEQPSESKDSNNRVIYLPRLWRIMFLGILSPT